MLHLQPPLFSKKIIPHPISRHLFPHSTQIIQPRRVRLLILWLIIIQISIGRDSLDDSEEKRSILLQLTDYQWADFYTNSPLTDWRIHFTPPFTPPFTPLLFLTTCEKNIIFAQLVRNLRHTSDKHNT